MSQSHEGLSQTLDADGRDRAVPSHLYSGPLTEVVLVGAMATSVPVEALTWDAAGLTVPNSKTANALLYKEFRLGWEPKWVS